MLAAGEPGDPRLLAFGLDYVVIVGYLVVLTGVSIGALASGLRAAYSAAWSTAWSAELMGFFLLTLPVVLYFAILESTTGGATLGKRALRLRVSPLDRTQLSFGRSLLRSALKFLPWELAHLTIWHYVYATTPRRPATRLDDSLAHLRVRAGGRLPDHTRCRTVPQDDLRSCAAPRKPVHFL